MDKTSKMGLEGWVSFGWIQKRMALQAAGIQGTRLGQEKAQNMNAGRTGRCGAPWQEIMLESGAGTKPVRALKARMKNSAFIS